MRGASVEERRGCCWVILNRAADPHHRWPHTWPEVITQKYQFSSFNAGDPNAAKWPKCDGSADWKAFEEIVQMISALGDDPTFGANAYENLPPTAARPGWAEVGRITKVIGDTRFYKI